jgi:peptide deformylase
LETEPVPQNVEIVKEDNEKIKLQAICTDLEKLHKISEPIFDSEKSEIIEKLLKAMPDNALGLAAPQVETHKNAFLANLTSGQFIFINPRIIQTSSEKISSIEGCLSLPEQMNCVNRFARICIEAEVIRCPNENLGIKQFRLFGRDANIVQHEMDHLNGVLISDLPRVSTLAEKKQEEYKKRTERIMKKRQAKSQPKPIVSKQSKELSKFEKEKNKKRKYKGRKRQRKIISKLELNRAIQEGLVNSSSDPETGIEKQD